MRGTLALMHVLCSKKFIWCYCFCLPSYAGHKAPVLYLSRYINHNKDSYYRLLQSVRDDKTWSEWVVFILRAVAKNGFLERYKLGREIYYLNNKLAALLMNVKNMKEQRSTVQKQ